MKGYKSLSPDNALDRRNFFKLGGAVGAGLVLGGRTLFALAGPEPGQNAPAPKSPPPRPKTNIEDALKVPRTAHSLPGPFPGKVVEVNDPKAMPDGKPDAKVIGAMFEKGLARLTDKTLQASFGLFFAKNDVVGLKVNPVGPGLISTRL